MKQNAYKSPHDLKEATARLERDIQALTLKRRRHMAVLRGSGTRLEQDVEAFIAKRSGYVALLRGHGLKRF